jgi:hypothetical protein
MHKPSKSSTHHEGAAHPTEPNTSFQELPALVRYRHEFEIRVRRLNAVTQQAAKMAEAGSVYNPFTRVYNRRKTSGGYIGAPEIEKRA